LEKFVNDGESKLAVNMMIGTRHPEFVPVAMRILWSQNGGEAWYKVRPYVYAWSRQLPHVHAELLRYLRDRGQREDGHFFDRWQTDGVDLSEDEVQQLCRAKDPWIRAWTYRTFPDQCGEAVRRSLLQESAEIREFVLKSSKGD
jgi:hypothetical protein